MGAFVATERILKPNAETPPATGYLLSNQFRIEHTGVIREIRLWMLDLGLEQAQYGFLVNGVDQFPTSADWFTATQNGIEYLKSGLNIPVVKGQMADFYQIGVQPYNVQPTFIYETEIP